MNIHTFSNAIYLFPSLQRILEVAVFGGYDIRAFTHKDYGKQKALEDLHIAGVRGYLHRKGELYYEHCQPHIHTLLNPPDGISTGDLLRKIGKLKTGAELVADFASPGACRQLIKTSFEKMQLSTYDYNLIIDISRTIATLDGADKVQVEHVAEAIHYRFFTPDYANDHHMIAVLD